MSITIELPPDVEKRLAALPDLDQRVADFLRDQLEYEKWRKARDSDDARQIVREWLADAERDKAAGVSRAKTFREFFEVYDRITAKLTEADNPQLRALDAGKADAWTAVVRDSRRRCAFDGLEILQFNPAYELEPSGNQK